jgi:hypothetical protein
MFTVIVMFAVAAVVAAMGQGLEIVPCEIDLVHDGVA